MSRRYRGGRPLRNNRIKRRYGRDIALFLLVGHRDHGTPGVELRKDPDRLRQKWQRGADVFGSAHRTRGRDGPPWARRAMGRCRGNRIVGSCSFRCSRLIPTDHSRGHSTRAGRGPAGPPPACDPDSRAGADFRCCLPGLGHVAGGHIGLHLALTVGLAVTLAVEVLSMVPGEALVDALGHGVGGELF